MLGVNFIKKSYQKVNDNIDVSLHNIFSQFPDYVQDSVDFFVRDLERSVILHAVGLEHKKVNINELTWHYLESKKNYSNQKKETILFIHGFSDNKFSFALVARELVSRYHIISIDLPGFGDSDKPLKEKYTIQNYQDWVLEFINTKGIVNFHIMGSSMGGAICAGLAADHPKLFKTITLVGAAGVMGDELQGIYKAIKEGENVFAINDMDEFNRLMKTVFVKPPHIPFIIKHYRLRKILANREWYEKVLHDLTGDLLAKPNGLHNFNRDSFLNEKVKNIKNPVLLLWGNEDKLVPIALGELYNKLINNSKLVVMQNVGHLPQIESPVHFARDFNDFISKLAS